MSIIAVLAIAAIVWRICYPRAGLWSRRFQKVCSIFGLIALLLVAALFFMVGMPGQAFQGNPPSLEGDRAALRRRLEQDVSHLSMRIGERNAHSHPDKLARAADFIESRFVELGYRPDRQLFDIAGDDGADVVIEVPDQGQPQRSLDEPPKVVCANIEVEIPGGELADEIVVVGAHYDSAFDTPGANDNASGTAALLELARHCAEWKPRRTLRFVAFANEEPPYFQGPEMGSVVYASRSRKRSESLAAVISLETIGFFTDTKGSQQYPPPFGLVYPSEGNFIGVIGNMASRGMVREAIGAFRSVAEVPSEGGALPEAIPGVGWSDHWAFWQYGYRAIMITDTAPFRYRYYHRPEDTPDKLDFDRMALVVDALPTVIEKFVEGIEQN